MPGRRGPGARRIGIKGCAAALFSGFAAAASRLDAVYRDESSFVALKARLLASFWLIAVVFVPLNVVKLLWVQPPGLPLRFGLNAGFALAALYGLYWLTKGRIERAGNGFVLIAILPVHACIFLVTNLPQPLGAAIQLFVFDLVILLFAIVFASRRVAWFSLALIVVSQLAFHRRELSAGEIPGSLSYAAGTLLRDGLIAIVFVFILGMTLVAMIAAAYRRGEESLRETRALNENLGRLVAERTRDLEAATQRANEASRAKGDFLANMSHEIRTPLHGVIASADLLQHRTDLPPEAAEHARLIAESGDLLVKLLGDILDLSKIEAGQLALETHPFKLAPLVADSVALVSAKARAGGVRVETTIAPGLPDDFAGDSFRLRQILLNLLSNAIKFTPAGGDVRLIVIAADPLTRPVAVRFEVSDTGIGMDETTLRRLFERFAQADASTARYYGGTGLGLAISLRLVEMMGGRLEAESTPNQGSTFRFTIPLQPAEDPAPAPATAPNAVAPIGLRVLIVEDNAVNRKILGAQLDRLGCRHTHASDGEEALAAMQTEPVPDVVLMDCNMPGLDGWEATRRIRAWATDPAASAVQRRAAALPIIALTAATTPDDRVRCAEAGMTDFLGKPIKLAGLELALRTVVAP